MTSTLSDARPSSCDLTYLPRVVGIYSPRSRMGKGTIGNVLVDHYGYTRLQFSAPIRAAFMGLALSAGLDEDTIADCLEGDLKEQRVDPLPFSYREFAVGLGTKWGRTHVGENTWLNLWIEQANAVLADGGRVVVDDVRFPNEFETIPYMVTVWRPLSDNVVADPEKVEGLLRGYSSTWMFENAGSVFDLEAKVHNWARTPK